MDWAYIIDAIVRVASGIIAYLAVGIAMSPVMVKLDKWDSRVRCGLSPEVSDRLSHQIRGPFVVFWPFALVMMLMVAIFLGVSSFLYAIEPLFDRSVDALCRLSEWFWKD